MAHTRKTSRIALVSMPWSLFNRPSIQLGALKAYLETRSEARVDCFHPYLAAARSLGPETYTALSKNSWAGEALYSAILFPEHKERAAALFRKCCKDTPVIAKNFETSLHLLLTELDQWIAATDFDAYDLVGFSVCFSQLFSSLAAAGRIKHKNRDVFIVFGGSSCVGELGTSLVQQFPQVDHVIAGEGEEQLLHLCRAPAQSGKAEKTAAAAFHSAATGAIPPMLDCNTLPPADYHPYFRELETIFPGRPFRVRIPLEFSRGCWWRKCRFCNLNLQWQGYRYKRAENLLGELRRHIDDHQCLDYTFCDNALPPNESDRFFEAVKQWRIDLDFFAEIRAVSDPKTLALYRQGGLSGVQVGIEALSTTLLEKMNKGTTVIENLAVLKYCSEHDIRLDGNLIVEFPGSSQAEAEETLVNLDYALPFRPLSAATFFLGQGSPIDLEPKGYGISAVTRHSYYASLFPAEILANMHLLIKDYRGDKTIQQKRWRPVRRRLARWQEFHRQRKDPFLPALGYRDGGSFLIIRQERLCGPALMHRLKGVSRLLYLFCATIRSLSEIHGQFPQLEKKTVLRFLADLEKKHLLYAEDDTYLALAIHAKR